MGSGLPGIFRLYEGWRVKFTVPADNAYDPTAHLNTEDISVDNKANPSMARIKLKKSKTDPFRQGVDIYVGRTFGQLCPVAAILAYLAVRGLGKGPLFMFADGRFLTPDRFVTRVREALTAAGLDCSQYAGHTQPPNRSSHDSSSERHQGLNN